VVADEILRDTLEAVDDPDAATRELIELAIAGGGPDNITCIVADVIDTATTRLPGPAVPLLAGAAAAAAFPVDGDGSGSFELAEFDDDHVRAPLTGTRIIMIGDDLDPGLSGTMPLAAATENGTAPGTARARRSHRAQPRRSRPRRRRWPIMTAALAVLVAIVAVGGYEVVQWTHRQYYLGDSGGQVVIYRGISDPKTFLWLTLSRVYHPTGIPLDQVPASDQQMVTSASITGSLSQVQGAVKTISDAVGMCARQYSAMQVWDAKQAKYEAELNKAIAGHKSTKGIKSPGQPPSVNPVCPPARAFAPSTLSPTPAGRS
jgi:PPM family protein phosphatase